MNKTEEKYIIGICNEMCPPEEIKLREQQRLLHILEIIPDTVNNKLPKADKNKMVKCFSRSAAGKCFLKPENLRPPNVLLRTVNYLLDEVINKNDKVPYIIKYDFVMDRLRAVRQDMVIQNISRAHQIVILQPIVRFHAYSAYKCCEENINNFDSHINDTHLQECLKRLLCIYDYFDSLEKSANIQICNESLKDARPYFETMYLIFNLGNNEAINRAIQLPKDWRTNLVSIGLDISFSYQKNNLVRVCRKLNRLPVLLQSLAFLKMPQLRSLSLKMMSVAYNSKNICFPIGVLSKLLLYNSTSELISDCKYYGLKVDENGVWFMKTDFIEGKPMVKVKRSKEMDEKLQQIDLSTLLLYGEKYID
ncbi:SAC3 domain-containing protein 1 isoform X1 [Diorhabda carinulata]|uniref:SAC3 domain-containing protein 1 isoform X1 n=2 Tax=Diorhabda carinulata TaxID=1163345 RepID=UPI0025A15707|nr:SAC3 domain-containing protein 1 isoform X1 [Diorhabda carinulata]